MTEDQIQQIREALTVSVLANVAEAVLDRAFNEARGYIVEALLASLASASGARTWQPISTAPKDGTRVLVCKWPLNGPSPEEAFGIFVHRAAWWSGEGEGAWIVYNSMVREPECHFVPTHWMPLPDPPEAVPSSGERQET